MRSALLRGRDHTRLGITAAVAEGRAAIALSRGGAPKSYRYRDPNEDVALFAEGEGGILLAVADGHGGCDAAETAVEKLLASFAPAWTGLRRAGPARRLAASRRSPRSARLNAAILRARRPRRPCDRAQHARARAAPPRRRPARLRLARRQPRLPADGGRGAGARPPSASAAPATWASHPRRRSRWRASTWPACRSSPARGPSCSSPTASPSRGSASRCRRLRSPSAPKRRRAASRELRPLGGGARRGRARARRAPPPSLGRQRRRRGRLALTQQAAGGSAQRAEGERRRAPRRLARGGIRPDACPRPEQREEHRCGARRRQRPADRPRSRRRPR